MNEFGYMALMSDYVYLEDVGRNVEQWGGDIVKGGYGSRAGEQNRGRGRGRGVGRGFGMRGNAHNAHQASRSKRDVLKMQLDFRDIEMDMLPSGMERRTLNQSTWDFKNRTAILTLEFVFHPPPNRLLSSPEQPFRFLTHRNNLKDSILTCIRNRLSERKPKKDQSVPEWVVELVTPHPEDPDAFTNPTCVMPTRIDPLASLQSNRSSILRPGHIVRSGYYKLDVDKPLESVLKHKQFVEYPSIEVWEDGAFNGTIVDDQGAVQIDDEDERRPKRRKLNIRQGKKAINGLLGGYGSDESDGEGATEEPNAFGTLAGYASDGDENGGNPTGKAQVELLSDDGLGDEDAEGETDDEYVEENPEDLAVLLERLREAGALRDPRGDGLLAGMEAEDQVDWGESDEE